MKKLTITAFVIVITAVFAISATANEWSLYGSVRVATFYTSEELGKELERIPGTGQFVTVDSRNAANQDKEKNTLWNLQNNSRIGATVTGDQLEARALHQRDGVVLIHVA